MERGLAAVNEATKRDKWVDVLRGIAVFLVVLGHVYADHPLFGRIIAPIKMPMFYILSGYVMDYHREFAAFIKKLVRRLIPPLIFFSLFPLYLVKYAAAQDWQKLCAYVVDFLTGKRDWFVLSFLVSQLLVWVVLRIGKWQNIRILILSAACFLSGLLTSGNPVFNFWCLNTALTGVLFLSLGIWLKSTSREKLADSTLIAGCVILYALLIGLNWHLYPNGSADFHNVRYDSVCFFLAETIVGFAACAGLSMRLCSGGGVSLCALLGRHTLAVYLLHGFLYPWIQRLAALLGVPYDGLLAAAAISAVTCGIAVFVSMAAEKYVPWIIGVRKKS